VILRPKSTSERIPLTIASSDPATGAITLYVQTVGHTTHVLNSLEEGDGIADVVGPLGVPTEVRHHGTVVVVGGGLGTAIAYPTAAALVGAGNEVIAIVGGRSLPYVLLENELSELGAEVIPGGRSLPYVLLENELSALGAEVIPCTDDGSYGRHGLVTDVLADLMKAGRAIDHVFVAGPVPMMAAVADMTRAASISTIASLNPIMVDGTGMCGGCRVEVGGLTKFACVDGPDFNAHAVDFELLARRNRAYVEFEEKARRRVVEIEAAGRGETVRSP
jgi:ferredoxin--NADP+ reductase